MFVEFQYKSDSQRLFRIEVDDDTYGDDLYGHFRYHYDKNGNITQFKDRKNGAQVQCFSYDDLGRLKRGFVSDDDSGTSDDCGDGYWGVGTGWYDRSYDYDPLGNISSWTNEVNQTTQNYTYAQTGNAGPHAATSLSGVGSYTYDANGNQTSRPNGDTLTFDVANRLASYTTGGTTTTFTYDADGSRVVRDEGANETIYVGGIFEVDDTSTRSYYSFAGTVVAYRLQEGTTDERFYLISDHLGTNSHQVKYSDGTRSSQYYLPFGGDRGSTAGNLDTDRGYTGQTSDAAFSGLLFYNARYYDPALRRFISADTIIPNPGNPQDLNRYSYVRNNPLRYSDPTGHCTLSSGAKVEDLSGAPCTSLNPDYDPSAPSVGCGITGCTGAGPPQYFTPDIEDGIANTINVLYGQCDGWCILVSVLVGMTPVGWVADAVGCANGDNIACAGAVAGPLLRFIAKGIKTLRVTDNAVASATNTAEIPEVIYRGGGRSPSNLTLREGEEALSFRNSLSNPYPAEPSPVFRPGREYIGVDTSGLPSGSVVVDNVPPGHVSVFVDDVDLLRSLIVEKGRFPK